MKHPTRFRPFAALCGLLLAATWAAGPLHAQTPEWIWHDNKGAATGDEEVRYFRKVFTVPAGVARASLTVACDNEAAVFLNGKEVLENKEWSEPSKISLKEGQLKTGENFLAIRAQNHGGAAALLVQLEIRKGETPVQSVVSDRSWLSSVKAEPGWNSTASDSAGWTAPVSLGKAGVQPWGNVLASASAPKPARRAATPAESLYTLPGFKVELIHSADPEEGSWVAITKDNKGRLLVSPQYPRNNPDAGLLRVTLDRDGKVTRRDWIAKPLYDAQGLLFHEGAILAVVNKYSTRFESGLYRIRDNGNDQFDQIQLVKKFPGGGEHGPHTVELGPDGMLYILAGNHTKLPEGISADSPHRNYREDHLLPRQWDGNGHAAGILAPGGYVVRTDVEGKKWDLFCAGFRNPYDIAFNADGELFTFDADMEWDWGMPWYRPTRVNHCVSGGEYGWRSGTGKWPAYYPDSLGSVEIGIGCPTGIRFGTGAKFPAKYQRALYIMDWTYGRLMAVHLQPDGASYGGSFENFLCPAGLAVPGREKPPLNITDMVVGNDGALYFTVGGRGVQSGLYRVSYTGNESTAPAELKDTTAAGARQLRHRLEAFHGHQDSKAVDFLWPHLNSGDRSIRYAARIALEAQPVAEWKDRAVAEKSVNGGLTALLALARVGGRETQADLLMALKKFPLTSLPESQALDKLRVIQLSFTRQGRPSPELAKLAIEKLDALYPNKSESLNHELSQLLIYLQAPDAVEKTLTLMASASTQEERMHYLFHLRTAKHWTLDQRREYFTAYGQDRSSLQHPDYINRWFQEAGRPYGDGASFANFLKNFRKEAVENLTDAERGELASFILAVTQPDASGKKPENAFPQPQKRDVVKDWKTADLLPSLDQAGRGRDFKKGRQAFVDAQCLACHRFGNEGGGIGPDLTAVATRFARRDILESITEPSKVVSEQFQNTTAVLKDGEDVTGRLVDENATQLVLVPNPLQPENKITVRKADMKSRAFSKISPMPEGLASVLSKEEILDLIAFLESSGRASAAAFKSN
jgi:putative heme-binding domain-containing protein